MTMTYVTTIQDNKTRNALNTISVAIMLDNNIAYHLIQEGILHDNAAHLEIA